VVRVATIDSGVNPDHPHVRPVAGGVWITPKGQNDCYLDFLGHGTAVAGAIREKAPTAEIYAVKVFDRQLSTSGSILLEALDWCLERSIDFINLSLGTLNAKYISAFEERIVRAQKAGAMIVAAYEMDGQPAYPGSLGRVAAVVLDNTCPRNQYRRRQQDGRTLYAAAGYPREIPGVPVRHNLQGISFAVANITGFLAAQAAVCAVT
jgi:subtilisin family serine protease